VTARSLSVGLLGMLLSVVVLWTLISTKDATVLTALGLVPRAPQNPAPIDTEPFGRLLRLISAVLFLGSSYALTRRQGADPVAALGWSSVLFLTPGVLHSLRSMDLTFFALIVGSLALAVQPDLKPFDLVLAYAALGVAGVRHDWGWLEAAPATAAVLILSLRNAQQTVSTGRALVAFGGGLVVLLLAGLLAHSLRPTQATIDWPIRNVTAYFQVPPLGDPLTPGQGLGSAFAWVTLPLALLGWVLAVFECGARLVERLARGHVGKTAPWTTLVVALAAWLPACFQATTFLPLAAAAIVLAAWFCARLAIPRVAEGAIAINMLAVVSFHWWHSW
jgi:hypothetical protein